MTLSLSTKHLSLKPLTSMLDVLNNIPYFQPDLQFVFFRKR
jgi:hypothetical protein